MDAQTTFRHAARLHQTGNAQKAVPLYREALRLDPSLGDAALYLGLALQQTGDLLEAEKAFLTALHLLPDDPDALNGLGAVSLDLGKVDQAREAHLTALKMSPLSVEGLAGLGNAALAQGNTDEAILCFEKALAIRPDSPETLSNLGVALKISGRPQEAIKRFEAALTLMPDHVDTLYNLGNAWQARGDMAMARECYQAASRVDPFAVAPQWGACFSHLDMLYTTQREIEAARTAYALALNALDANLTEESPALVREAANAVGTNQPFYLTYQGGNDRQLQERYGTMIHRIMTAALPQFASPSLKTHGRTKIRVGIATGFMHEHSVWKIPTRGWVHHLDRTHFEVFGYYTGVKNDHCTEEAFHAFDKVTHEPNRFEALCQHIMDDELDVLLYPEIGMDPTCAKLACLRLAPIQCVSLGHPMTTGLPTMDYFLSSELMEPDNGQEAYTEKLVRLPGLSVHYEPLRQGPPAFDRAHFELSEDAVLYFCPQSLYKYLPQHDSLFPRIAEQVPNAKFLFLENAQADILNHRFAARIKRSFEEFGLEPDNHLTFFPHQTPERYHALNAVCDVFLDSIEWSGFNTAMEAANTGLPMVIYPVGHMRGRHSLAVATMLGLDDIIARSFERYVELAVRLGLDEKFRQQIRARTEANRTKLFGDMAPIQGLEAFLKQVAR